MTSLDQLKHTFFDECSEGLQQTEQGLSDIRDGLGNDETVNAVFRAVHSVKGGAGIFGFEALVEFAHVFETTLDAVRRGDLATSTDVMDTLLAASDVLSDLVQMSRSGDPVPAGFGSECRMALQALIAKDGGGGGADEAAAPADFEDIDFVPLRFDAFDAPAEAGEPRVYRIEFRPKPELLKNGSDPLLLLRQLRELGELELVAEVERLPDLTNMQPDIAYLGWTGTLRSSAPRAQVEEIFEFAAGDCELEIVEESAPAPALPAFEPLPAVEMPAGTMPAAVISAAAMQVVEMPSAVTIEAAPPIVPAARPPSGLAPAAEEAAAKPQARVTKPAATTTRIELEKIDRVVNMVGELVIAQAMLGQIVHDLPEAVSDRLSQILDEVVHHTRELKDGLMSMRAQAVGSVFQRMPRLVREVAGKVNKKVRLELAGETTEVDRSIIERLADPLTHIIRNSVDHGIELPADRLAAGKNEEGVVRLSAEHRGSRIVIEIADDGAGVNSDRVLKKAREKGLVGADATLTEDEINNLIMMPGFSTAETISDISGRGVGMDVVRTNIQEIGGRITLHSVRGKGMTIQLLLPLTLAVMDGMVIKVGRETYVMPMSAIVECLRPPKSYINNLVGTRGMLQLRGELVPLVYLGDLLDINSNSEVSGESVVLITDAGEGMRLGLVADELCGHQQVVVKSIEESYGPVPGVAAATILGNGSVALILDVEKLSELAGDPSSRVGASSKGGAVAKVA
jgi:two-component system chemotaxis sensor kinase CheA